MLALVLVSMLAAAPGGFRYEPLPEGGVAVIGADGQRRAVLLPGVPIARVFVQGDTLVIVEARQLATLYSLADPGAPQPLSAAGAQPAAAPEPAAPAPAPSVAAPAPVARGRVVKVESGRVIFELDSGSVEPRSHLRVISQRPVKKPDLATGEPREVPSNEVTAVVMVEQLEGNRGMAPIGRGDFAEEGDLVEPTTDELSERLMVPRRAPFTVRAGFMVRPFLGLEVNVNGRSSKPVGLLLDVYGAWYLPWVPIALELSVAPFGVAVAALEAHYPTTIAFTVAYSSDYFEIGIGVGGLLGNQGPCSYDAFGVATCEANNGVTINQVLRLGSVDGLSLVWRSSIFSRPQAFVFGVGRGEANVPLTSRLGLFAAGGAGENGWMLGELGVRTYVGGTGARGTMVLSASLGYSAVFDGPLAERAGGPSVAIGAEWRR